MSEFARMEKGELRDILKGLQDKFDDYKSQGLKLDMSRGKPCKEQLDLSNAMLSCLDESDYKTEGGFDCRNYGPDVLGIPEARKLMGDMLGVGPDEVIAGGNSSLSMMYDTVARAMTHGVLESKQPWGKLPKVKFLCPSPGYDRHFAICQHFGIEMIVVEMKEDGPDMDAVEKIVREDDAVKGIWCVPKYSNPEGKTYSSAVVKRFAGLKPKAEDFRIFWDNAYAVHHLTDNPDHLDNILDECKAAGRPDMVFIFGSTSKVSYAGAGLAAMAASKANIDHIKKQISIQTIGPDKINQLRHVKFFRTIDGINEHMKKHAAILRPKFEAVLNIFEEQLGGKNIAWWNKPNGGYFISLNVMEGCAKAVVAMAAEAGVTLTGAGATFPYGKDPADRNIRIAPTMPPVEELKKAMDIVCTCIQIISIKKILEAKA